MASNKQEPKFWPEGVDQHVDQHVAETFGPLLPDGAPYCYGEFDRTRQRKNGCLQCAFHAGCTQYTIMLSLQKPEESDPTGRTANDPGAKLDAGKTRLWLVLGGFANALEEVGKVGTFGARKYSDDGWKQVPDGVSRYSDALMRHLLAEAAGEDADPDSGLLHAAHAAWNALARLELTLRNTQ